MITTSNKTFADALKNCTTLSSWLCSKSHFCLLIDSASISDSWRTQTIHTNSNRGATKQSPRRGTTPGKLTKSLGAQSSGHGGLKTGLNSVKMACRKWMSDRDTNESFSCPTPHLQQPTHDFHVFGTSKVVIHLGAQKLDGSQCVIVPGDTKLGLGCFACILEGWEEAWLGLHEVSFGVTVKPIR